uniref:30S ribosomal protein S11 n=1 Tax=Haemonchus contortus TaxID=6289 RepID=A0A7I4YVE5_HAECO
MLMMPFGHKAVVEASDDQNVLSTTQGPCRLKRVDRQGDIILREISSTALENILRHLKREYIGMEVDCTHAFCIADDVMLQIGNRIGRTMAGRNRQRLGEDGLQAKLNEDDIQEKRVST